MKLVWPRRAIRHLISLRSYIAAESEQNAAIVAGRILDSVNLLEKQPLMGTEGRIDGTRELVIPRTPYIVVYRVRDETIELLAVFSGHRRWPTRL